MRLQDKVALITGGTSGIGEATALLFAREGAKVAITGRNEKRGHAVIEQILNDGGQAIFLRTDVRKAAECRRAVDETISAFGRLDILFNNAGVFNPHTTLDCSEEEWDLQIDVNLKGTFLMSKFALPGMIEQGSGVIINNSSGWGIVGGDAAIAYCASKGGVVLLTKAMAIDHGRQGIRVNCICPGDVDTPMLPEDARMRGQKWEDYLARSNNRPLGRIRTSDEIAKAALILASPARADDLGVIPLARVVSSAVYGNDPRLMGIAPAWALPLALRRAGLTPEQIDVWEIHEAFSAQALGVLRELPNQLDGFQVPDDKLTPNGGAVAIGHPFGATGVRYALTLATELRERHLRYGAIGVCIGSGQGVAMILENPRAA